VTAHEAKYGRDALATVPIDLLLEAMSQAEDIHFMRMFRAVCASRSILGRKTYVGTNKETIRARMIGAKTKEIGATLKDACLVLAEEGACLKKRRRFDLLMGKLERRGFFRKYGAYRKIYLSTQIAERSRLIEQVDRQHGRGAPLGTV